MGRFVALLRAVNVGGRKVPMAELRALCEALGWSDVETYIQSGNIVFAAPSTADALEKALESAIRDKFKLEVPVVVRSAVRWRALVEANPMRKEAEAAPNRVQLLVSKQPQAKDAAERLMERAADGEQVKAAGDGLWFHFPNGVARSKLTPALIDKACGSPATGRNWRTVLRLAEMVNA